MILREVRVEDLPVLFEQQRDADALAMAEFPARDRQAFFAHWTTRVLADPDVHKAVAVVDGQVAGHVGSFEQGGRRLVGYWFGKEFWGRGIATSALSEFLGWESARPLFAIVARRNVGSIRVLQKCGFEIVSDAAERATLLAADDDAALLELAR
jgi:RimJ/RimL family protein N-acetyltransferase